MIAVTHAGGFRSLRRRALPLVGGAALATAGIGGGIVLLVNGLATGSPGYLVLSLLFVEWGALAAWDLLLPGVLPPPDRWYNDRSARRIFLAAAGNAPFTVRYRDSSQAFPVWSTQAELQPPCPVTELFETLAACLARVPNYVGPRGRVGPPWPLEFFRRPRGIELFSRFLTDWVKSNVVGLEHRGSGLFAVHLRGHTREFRIRDAADRFERDALAVIARNVVALVADHGEVAAVRRNIYSARLRW